MYAECKLSRPGPPATIVTIDEESPNGMYQTLISALILSLFHNVNCFCTQVAWIALLGLFLYYSECCVCNSIHINTCPAETAYGCGVIEYSCSADGSWGRLVYRRCFVRHIELSFWFCFKWKINTFYLLLVGIFARCSQGTVACVCVCLTEWIQMVFGIQMRHGAPLMSSLHPNADCLYCGIPGLQQYRTLMQNSLHQPQDLSGWGETIPSSSSPRLSTTCTHFSALSSFPLFSFKDSLLMVLRICHLRFLDDEERWCESVYACDGECWLLLGEELYVHGRNEGFSSPNRAGGCLSHSVLPVDISTAG